MRKIFFYSLSVLFLSLGYSCSSQKVTNNSDKLIVSNKLKWSERMTLSEIHRFPDPTLLDFREKPKWSYTNGLVLDAMYKVYKQTNNTKIYDYIYDFGNRMINQNGEIMTFPHNANQTGAAGAWCAHPTRHVRHLASHRAP